MCYRWIALYLFLGTLLTGCTANKMHRPVSVEQEASYELAFIEFDDQGEMWDRTQLSRALSVIERANRAERGCVVVTYMHGWQHNASEKSEIKGNVGEFKTFLSSIAQRLEANPELGARPLVGIYLGWRGKSGSIPGLNLLTFYDRAGAARRIAGTSSTEAIYRILATAKQNRNSKTLLLGHSFGGQILERALTQSLVGSLLGPSVAGSVELPADLTVLINPAAKSIQAKQFVEMLDHSRIGLYRTDREGNRHRVPLMVSVTSSADLATRWAFPLGTQMSAIGKNFHKYGEDSCLQFKGQRSFYVRTPGHNAALISHEVTAEPLPSGARPASLEQVGSEWLESDFDPISGRQVFSFNGSEHRFTVRPLTGAVNGTPYWIIRVPRQLIPGHSGFFTADTLRLIGSMVVVSGLLEEESSVEIVRDSGVRPNWLTVLPDGQVLVVDASRRIYGVEVSSPRPTFNGCMPPEADPITSIGFGVHQSGGFAAFSRLSSESTRKGTDEYESAAVEFEVSEGTIRRKDLIKIHGTDRFVSAAFDLESKRAYLAGVEGKAIYSVDLTAKKATPELWLDTESEELMSSLVFDNSTRSLYAASGTEGVLYRLTDEDGKPQAALIADSLGWPVGIAIDQQRGRLYVGDAKGRQIWQIDCTGSGECSEPRSLIASEIFVSPGDLNVAPDGTIWVADREGQVIVALSPEGEILQKIEELPR